MAKTKTKKSAAKRVSTSKAAREEMAVSHEMDGVYFLKLVLYLIIGSQWVRIMYGTYTIPIPVGLIIGCLFARHERFQVDRKLEYAILLMAMFVGFWMLPGIDVLI